MSYLIILFEANDKYVTHNAGMIKNLFSKNFEGLKMFRKADNGTQ